MVFRAGFLSGSQHVDYELARDVRTIESEQAKIAA